jgi:hypothetical protein
LSELESGGASPLVESCSSRTSPATIADLHPPGIGAITDNSDEAERPISRGAQVPLRGDPFPRALGGRSLLLAAGEACAVCDPDRVAKTSLFTDIVGSTEMAVLLGDAALG